MNLLPADVRERGKPGQRARGVGPFLWRALVVGLTLVVIGLDVHELETRLEGARADRNRLGALIAEREDEKERLATSRERLQELRVAERRLARWDEERFVVPELLRGLSLAVPAAVVLEEVRREGAEFRATGRASSAAMVARALDGFSGMERILDMELLWVERVDAADGAEEQRFAVAGSLRYLSREPQPFDRVEAVSSGRELPR